MDIIKNPVVLGLIAGVLTYIYLWWSKSNNSSKKNGKKYKKDKGDVNIMIPGIVALVVWFIAYGYTEFGTTVSTSLPHQVTALPNLDTKYKMVKTSSSDSIRSFNLINKGVSIPSALPDVFIETY